VSTTPDGLDTALHHVLLRLAGRASDETICTARDWLARGRVVDVAQAVAFVALADRIPMTRGDVAVLEVILSDAGIDPDPLAELDLVEIIGMPLYAMAPVNPGPQTNWVDTTSFSLDLTTDATASHSLDEVDRAVVAAAVDGDVDAAVWRAWRCPALPTPWPPPRRIFLVQALDPRRDPLPALTARLQRAALQAGETAPQVEVFAAVSDLAPYQRTALGCSALLWTGRPTPPIQIADVFDSVDSAGGPGFVATRPTLDEPERTAVLRYLDTASPLLMTTAVMDDVVNQHRAVVPMSFRTDGQWIWTDAVGYYLRHYALAPDPQLLQHIRTGRYEVRAVDPVAQHRSLAALQRLTSGEDG
jgi:hypothetical protein